MKDDQGVEGGGGLWKSPLAADGRKSSLFLPLPLSVSCRTFVFDLWHTHKSKTNVRVRATEMRGKGREGEECKGQTETSATQQERRTGACLCCVDPAGHPKAGAVRQTGALMSWLPHNPLLLGPLRFVDCVHKHRPPPLVLLHGCALTAPLTVLSWWEARVCE